MTAMNVAVVVTTISAPSQAMSELAAGCAENGYRLYVVGDVKSPVDYPLPASDYYNLDRQRQAGFRTAHACPTRHYARKNFGYLAAIRDGALIIIETDDDNFPMPGFWLPRQRSTRAPLLSDGKWVNIYAYFSDANIWPRGLPLDVLREPIVPIEEIRVDHSECPIQQGLCNGDADVDATYRLIIRRPVEFQAGRALALAAGSWCPFNSQNTAWWPEAYPLLYLPSTCSLRMTDIWRSFVAQRIAWSNGWSILFHSPTVYQHRNPHDLMRDFSDEIPGYLNNRAIVDALGGLDLAGGEQHTPDNMRRCYEEMVRLRVLQPAELPILNAWLADLEILGAVPRGSP